MLTLVASLWLISCLNNAAQAESVAHSPSGSSNLPGIVQSASYQDHSSLSAGTNGSATILPAEDVSFQSVPGLPPGLQLIVCGQTPRIIKIYRLFPTGVSPPLA